MCITISLLDCMFATELAQLVQAALATLPSLFAVSSQGDASPASPVLLCDMRLSAGALVLLPSR